MNIFAIQPKANVKTKPRGHTTRAVLRTGALLASLLCVHAGGATEPTEAQSSQILTVAQVLSVLRPTLDKQTASESLSLIHI